MSHVQAPDYRERWRSINVAIATLRAIAPDTMVAKAPLTGPRPTFAAIAEMVGFEMGVALADIVGPEREARLIRARAAACWLALVGLRRPPAEIAMAFGRSAASVTQALRRAEHLRERDPAFRMVTTKLLDRLDPL